jgi:hypothetical protein
MSFNIPNILSKFTRTQRIVALVLLLGTTVALTLGPSIIESFAPDNKSLHSAIKLQRKQIDSLNIDLFNQSQTILDLNRKIVFGQQECTNAMSQREAEIVDMIRGIKGSLNQVSEIRMDPYVPDSGVSMMILPPEPRQDNTKMLKALNELEYKVKHHK